jgi:hypothetical protein
LRWKFFCQAQALTQKTIEVALTGDIPVQLRDAVLTPKAVQHNTDLLMMAGRCERVVMTCIESVSLMASGLP